MLKLRNNTNEQIIIFNHLFQPNGDSDDTYEIPNLIIPQWADNSEVIENISNGNIILSLYDTDILNISKAIDILKNITPKDVNSVVQPFANKILSNGKKIFTRIHGVTGSVQNTPDNINFTIPYAACKISGIEIIGAKVGDKANFKVLDTSTGTISGVPNYTLNQFGFDVYISPTFYTYTSQYDADLIQGLVLRVEYDAIDELLPRDIFINFILHEVTD